MDDFDRDENDETQLSSPALSVAIPPFIPPEFSPNSQLTEHQKKLLKNYLLHEHYETGGMNNVVELTVCVQRERDEPSLGYLLRELEEAQSDLAMHRHERRKADRQVQREEERVSKIFRETRVDEERGVARKQLDEIEEVMKRQKKIECLR